MYYDLGICMYNSGGAKTHWKAGVFGCRRSSHCVTFALTSTSALRRLPGTKEWLTEVLNTMSILFASWLGRGMDMILQCQLISSVSCSIFCRRGDAARLGSEDTSA